MEVIWVAEDNVVLDTDIPITRHNNFKMESILVNITLLKEYIIHMVVDDIYDFVHSNLYG